MADKNINFVQVELKNMENNQKMNIKYLKVLFEEVFNKYAIKGELHDSVDLSPDIIAGGTEPKVILDIYPDSRYLFGRICRQKPNNSILSRDYGTLLSENAVKTEEEMTKGIETFNVFMLDYTTGILAILNSKDAPGRNFLSDILIKYGTGHFLKFTDVPNANGIDMLYNSTDTELMKIEFERPLPTGEYLQKVLGLKENELVDILNSDIKSVHIALKGEKYKSLEKDKSRINKIIDIFRVNKNTLSSAVIKARSKEFNSREFSFQEQYYSYPIKYSTFKRNENGDKVPYTLYEMVQQFISGLKIAYEENFDALTTIIGFKIEEWCNKWKN